MTKITDLEGLIDSYYQNKQSLNNYKELTEQQNENIKELLKQTDDGEYTTMSGKTAKLVKQVRETFIDDLLIKKLKELGVTSPIKTVEVVDPDELENVIYNHELDAAELADCKQIKEIWALKVKEAKGVK